MIKLTTPLDPELLRQLRAGSEVSLSGVIYTARDAAHKRMFESCRRGEALPVNLNNQVIYYAGPCPAKPGEPIGSVGPTTSGRVDAYTPCLIRNCGLKGMIGKGYRSREVVDAMREKGAVYFIAIGGAAALIARRVQRARVVAYPDLGPEAIYELEVEAFPLIVGIDSQGGNAYTEGQQRYRRPFPPEV